MDKSYQPSDYEANIYALWETSGAFAPSGAGQPYSIVMPPPNANGNLHAGHALFVALEDILTRYHRMRGCDTIWIPGADHAGFETWVVFERWLSEQGKSRFDYSRDQLYQMTWDFVAENRGKMELQLRALGASCDWSRQVFTLDEPVVDVVFTTFKKLWDDGLVYRGERLVNYCTFHQTSFADIEVEYKEEKGKLWYIRYPLVTEEAAKQLFRRSPPLPANGADRATGPPERSEMGMSHGSDRLDGTGASEKLFGDSSGYIVIATTRPETILGDEAVAVHPGDPRYSKLVGQELILPLVGKAIPLLADEMVEQDFGTGAVKVTPAHDQNDFELGQRHGLPLTSVIGADGKIIAPAPAEFVGLSVQEARRQVVAQLESLGLIEKVETHRHQVPHCYKCGRVIEPLLKEQWFINVKPLAAKAIAAIKADKVKFTPQQKKEELIRYYQELKDWNISRQIPWGIPIPAFKKSSEQVPQEVRSEDSASEWIFDPQVSEREIIRDGVRYLRDEDTFDTWFSSGQWPYIVTRGDLERFYPNSVMETGFDIFRAWVARMIMLGLYMSGEVPFEQVYLHGLVNDEHNQKMSKSKGNVINPMGIVEEYGSDACRLGIIANRSAAQSQAFSTATVVAGRNFCNKLWNIARYLHSALHSPPPQDSTAAEAATYHFDPALADHWILHKLNTANSQIAKLLEAFRFAEAYEVLYHVIWDDLADWWLESTKNQSSDQAIEILEYALKLAHPFAPFVTETIWQALHSDDKTTTLLISQPWPEKIKIEKANFEQFEALKKIVSEVRARKAELGQEYGKLALSEGNLPHQDLIAHLARLEEILVNPTLSGVKLQSCPAKLLANERELADYRAGQAAKLARAQAQVKALQARLENKNYLKNAPRELVEETKQQLREAKKLAKSNQP